MCLSISPRHILLGLLSAPLLAAAYKWPDPAFDFPEEEYTTGRLAVSIGGDCKSSGLYLDTKSGRSNAAQWLRFAYHDVATHDSVAGTGGLDASLAWELDHPENIGNFEFTLGILGNSPNYHMSASDNIALGTVIVSKFCGGPSIPYRIGRVDASGPGPVGVPLPHEDLATHTAAFKRQGFSATDMINLVACGHTLGGVHEVDFPNTIHGAISSSNTDGVVHFDSSDATFDNKIATDYISNRTGNPLVVGFNKTTNSDARIFASDGNATIRALAKDNNYFLDTCAKLFERMIDTVPKDVKLSEPIEPLVIKPANLQITPVGNGTLRFTGSIRIFDKVDRASWNPKSMPVSLKWKDREGKFCGSACTANATAQGYDDKYTFWGNLEYFDFDILVPESTGISSFTVDWALGPDKPVQHADNGGAGFPVQDYVLVLRNQACIVPDNAKPANNKIVVEIRSDQESPSGVQLAFKTRHFDQSIGLGQISLWPTEQSELKLVGSSASPLYSRYEAIIPANDYLHTFMNVTATIGGKELKVIDETLPLIHFCK